MAGVARYSSVQQRPPAPCSCGWAGGDPGAVGGDRCGYIALGGPSAAPELGVADPLRAFLKSSKVRQPSLARKCPVLAFPRGALGLFGPCTIAGWEWKGNASTRVFLMEKALLFDLNGMFARISLAAHPQG